MIYQKKGSGAIILVGDIPVKASAAAREAGLLKLQKRFGPYQPPAPRQQIAQREPREPEPIKDVPGWQDYIAGRQAHHALKSTTRMELDQRQEQERKEMAEHQKSRRAKLLRGDWRGKGDVLNAMRSVIAAEQAAGKAAGKEKHQRERAGHRQQFQP